MAGANNPDREYRAFLAGIGAPEAFEADPTRKKLYPAGGPTDCPDASQTPNDGGHDVNCDENDKIYNYKYSDGDENASYGSYLHDAADEQDPDSGETDEFPDEAASVVSEERVRPRKRRPGAGRHEMAWPALLVLFVALAWLPQGPDLVGSALAGVGETVASDGTAVASEALPTEESAAAAPAGEGEATAEGEEAPPPPGKPEEIEQQAEGLLAGKKFDAAADLVRENDALLTSSPRLLEILLEAGIQTTKPNWLDIGNKAQVLVDQNPDSPVGNLALGMSWAERKKADLAKALEYLAKAKSSKKALPMANLAYWTVWAKKNWPMMAGALALILIGGFKVVQKRKQNRQTASDLERALAEAQMVVPGDGAVIAAPGEAAEMTGQNAASPAVTPRPAQPESEQALPPAAAKSAAKVAARPGVKLPPKPGAKPAAPAHKPVQKPVASSPKPALTDSEQEEPDEGDRLSEEERTSVIPPSELPLAHARPAVSAAPVVPAYPKPVARPAAPAIEETPDLSGIDLVSAHLQTAGMPPRQPPHLPGREAETVWQNLVRQASARPLPLEVREPAPPLPTPPVIDPATAGEVTLDLSEKAAAAELVTKLRMLAINDGELRALLQLRNPEHLPALVEYITMKPDPVRLAFLAREMGHFHDPAVSDILSSLLYHPDHRVGLSAIQGLQINGGAESVLAICPFLESDVPVLVDAARTALMDFGPQRVLEGLARLPSSPDERARSAGVFVLSRMRGPAIARLLVAMLGDRSAEVRQKVILAMANQKDPAYLATLREYVRQAPEEDRKLLRKAIVFLQTLEKAAG